jgi:hypothetical protein
MVSSKNYPEWYVCARVCARVCVCVCMCVCVGGGGFWKGLREEVCGKGLFPDKGNHKRADAGIYQDNQSRVIQKH